MRKLALILLALTALAAGAWWWQHRIPPEEIGATVILLPAGFAGARFALEGAHADPALADLRREVPYDEWGVQAGSWPALRADADGAPKIVVKIGGRKTTDYQLALVDNSPERLKFTFVRATE